MTTKTVKKKYVSMQTVADHAGVSKATVSKVFNNKADVSDKVRKKVMTVCKQVGYQLNPNVQDMLKKGMTGYSQDIAFVLVGASFEFPEYSGMTEGISTGIEKNNFHLILTRLSGKEENVYNLPPALRDRRVGGIILSGELTEHIISLIQETNIPYVIVGNYNHSITSQASCVELNTGKMLYNLVRKLISCGKKRIAFFYENPDNFYSKQGFEEFKEALKLNNIALYDELIYKGKGGYYNAFDVMEKALQKDAPDFDSIICLNFSAAQEISCLLIARFGRSISNKITVATLKNTSKSLIMPSIYCKEITSRLAENGVVLLIENMKNDKLEVRNISFTPEVISECPLENSK